MKKKITIAIIVCLIVFTASGVIGFINYQIIRLYNDANKEIVIKKNTKLSGGEYKANFQGVPVVLKAAYIVDGVEATIGSGEYETLKEDEIVFLVVNGGKLIIKDSTINKTGDASKTTEDNDLYGINSAIVVLDKSSKVTLEDVKINTDATYSNAIFATKSGNVNIKGSTINTNKESSRALYASQGAKIKAENVKINTFARKSPAAEAYMNEAKIDITGNSKITTSAEKSPIMYSVGEIITTGLQGNALKSQAAIIEGKNTIKMNNVTMSCNTTECISLNEDNKNKIKSANNNAFLKMTNSTLRYLGKGPIMNATNINSTIELSNMFYEYKSKKMLTATKKSIITINNNHQELIGGLTADGSSSIVVRLNQNSSYTGHPEGTVSILIDNTSSKKIE